MQQLTAHLQDRHLGLTLSTASYHTSDAISVPVTTATTVSAAARSTHALTILETCIKQTWRTAPTDTMRAMLKVRFVMPRPSLAELRPCTQLASLQHAYLDRLYAQAPVHGERHQPHRPSSRYCCSSTDNKCWQCGNQTTAASLFFCQSCKAIQPPAEAPDLFVVMGL